MSVRARDPLICPDYFHEKQDLQIHPPGMSSTVVVDPARAAESNLARILAITGTVHFTALVIASLRIYARVIILKSPGRDDAVMALATLCALGGYICFVLGGYHGLGRHTDVISTADITALNEINFYQSLVSAMTALGLLKISIAFSLLRLSKNRWYSRSLWALIAFVCAYTFMAWMSILLMCQPVSGFWDKSAALGAKCYPIPTFIQFGLINTGLNIFTDVCFASLPIPIIWDLQLKTRARVYLVVVLSLGYIAVAMGIVKAVYQIAFATNPDKTFDQSLQMWGFLQLNVGIIAACAPTLKPLVGRVLKLSSSYNQYGQYNDLSRTGNMARSHAGRQATGGVSRNMEAGPGFEMQSRSFAESDAKYRTNIKGGPSATSTAIYPGSGTDGDRSGSEELIFAGLDKASKGITRTTEITVHK